MSAGTNVESDHCKHKLEMGREGQRKQLIKGNERYLEFNLLMAFVFFSNVELWELFRLKRKE